MRSIGYMATIKSVVTGGKELDVQVYETAPGEHSVSLLIMQDGAGKWAISVDRAELAAALGLESKRVHPRASGPTLVESHIERLRARAEEAEATIARIKSRVDASTSGWLKRELQACIEPKPAFVLPTEAGVRFTAKRVGNLSHTSEFVTITDGAGTAFYFIPDDPDGYTKELDRIWPADCVMSDWTGHRLIKPQP